MGDIRCAHCGGSAVDHEGYCWTCERQNEVAGQPPPDWIVPGEDPFRDMPALPAPRPRKVRIRVVVLPALITSLVLIFGVGGVMTFRFLDTLMTAPPSDTVAAGASPGASGSLDATAACLVGEWRQDAVDETIDLDEAGLVHVTGNGGSIRFAADGTGSETYSGTVLTGVLNGSTMKVTLSGTVTFRYSVYGKKLVFEYIQKRYSGTVSIGNQAKTVVSEAEDGGMTFSCGADTLKMISEDGVTTSSRVS
ncbi:MAG: hypothetical protein JXA67_01855 [Micromonosporaceae bacterium]|nr:hypothetical protein [Micromonosporaceae bacterium]